MLPYIGVELDLAQLDRERAIDHDSACMAKFNHYVNVKANLVNINDDVGRIEALFDHLFDNAAGDRKVATFTDQDADGASVTAA